MSLFAKNYTLTDSATYHGEEPKSPKIGAFSKRTIGRGQSLSNSSLRNVKVPLSPAALSKAKFLFSKTHQHNHGSLDIELGALSVNHMPSPRRLSSSTEVPTLGYSSGPAQEDPVTKDGHASFTTSKSPFPVNEAKVCFTRPSRNGSKHVTIAVDPSAFNRARKETQSPRNSDGGYSTYEACMEGARGHEKKSGTYPQGSEKASPETIVSVACPLTVQGFALQAKHHLSRSSDLFGASIAFKPDQIEALIGRCRVVVALADCYQPVNIAVPNLKDALANLQGAQENGLLERRPKTLALQAKALMLLSSLLHELEHTGVVPSIARTWKSEIGEAAREAMRLCEEVATMMVTEAENTPTESRKSAASRAIDAVMTLASSALQVGNLAPTQALSDKHYGVVELALDRASTLVIDVKPLSGMETSINNPFLTQIHLKSCEASIARIQHLFALGGSVDEDEFKAVICDLEVLSDRERSRAKSIRGSKAATASTAAFHSLKQLADTRYQYACLLRQIWRKRKALPAILRRTSTSSLGSNGSDGSIRRPSVDVTHRSGSASLLPTGRTGSKSGPLRKLSYAGDTIPEMDETSEDNSRGSASGESSQCDEALVTPLENLAVPPVPLLNRKLSQTAAEPMSPRRPDHSTLKRPSFISPFDSEAALTAGGLDSLRPSFEQRRGSWMPSGDLEAVRARRLSSIGLAKQDATISAWNRQASVISIASEEGAPYTTSSTLVSAAWNLLGEAIKEYKLSLTVLSRSHLLASDLAQQKSEVLLAIADASLFKASLAPRLSVAAEKRTSLLVTAEVYATWAAREVGWASVIEGPKESRITEKRTSSWRADEAGRMAVLTLLRAWWYRAATGSQREADIRGAAKDAVDKVTRRLAQRSGTSETLVAKFRYKLLKNDGDLDTAENLFWSTVRQNLIA